LSLVTAIANRNIVIAEAGKNALNIKYPKEFELYVIALELTDENFNTLKYFVFPINPSSLEENIPQVTNIKKTNSGVSVLKNPTFVPTDITLSGTFGRGFKVLLGDKYEDFVSSFSTYSTYEGEITGTKVTNASLKDGLKQTFDDRIKTGYGCIKILEEIVKESVKLGKNGEVRKLIFHNPALGNSYFVEAGTLRLFQNEQTNMIWNYSLPLKSIAPLESRYTKKQMESIAIQLNVTNHIQKRVNALVRNVSKMLAKGVEALPQ
jgi:hypothetical protein